MTRTLTVTVALIALLAATLALQSSAPADAQDNQLCVTDDAGDNPDNSTPDVLEACIVIVGQTVQFTAQFAGDEDLSNDDFDMLIDTDGDTIVEFIASTDNGDWVLNQPDGTDICANDYTLVDGRLETLGLETSCFDADQVRFFVRGERLNDSSLIDRAPESGFTGFLQLPTGGPGDPAPPAGEVGRLAGPSRIDTSVEISQFQFPAGSRDVYLSRQDVFADSISSGSLTEGPVLLVPQCGTVPQVVLDEVARLAPDNVYALGGDAAVCDQVLNDVAAAAGF